MRKDIDFDQFKSMLEAERTDTQQRMEQETNSLQSYSDPNPDLLDVATNMTDQSGRIGLINHLRERQTQIEEAIQRLENGKFGICAHCGEDIEVDRLRAKSYARYCVRCKENKEQGNW